MRLCLFITPLLRNMIIRGQEVVIVGLIAALIMVLASQCNLHSVEGAPSVSDKKLKVQTVAQGLSSPTSIAFIDSKNILVLEKNTGNVRLISNGVLQPNSILTVSVNGANERGLLGVATLTNIKTFVFLYYTEQVQGQELRNRVYRYEWTGSSLSNPALILDLPALPGPNHNGGKLLISSDKNLYVVIGDLNHNSKLTKYQRRTGSRRYRSNLSDNLA